MSMIDTAAFFVVLDDFDHEIDNKEPSTLGDVGKVSEICTRTQNIAHEVMLDEVIKGVTLGWQS